MTNMTDDPFDDDSRSTDTSPFEGDTDSAGTGQEPRTVSTTRIEIDGDDERSNDAPLVYTLEENPGENFGVPHEPTFAVALDVAIARSESMAEAVDLVLDEWVELYCRHLCGFRDAGSTDSLSTTVAEVDHLRRPLRTQAISSLGTATADVPDEYQQEFSSFRSEIQSRVEEIPLEDSTAATLRANLRETSDSQ